MRCILDEVWPATSVWQAGPKEHVEIEEHDCCSLAVLLRIACSDGGDGTPDGDCSFKELLRLGGTDGGDGASDGFVAAIKVAVASKINSCAESSRVTLLGADSSTKDNETDCDCCISCGCGGCCICCGWKGAGSAVAAVAAVAAVTAGATVAWPRLESKGSGLELWLGLGLGLDPGHAGDTAGSAAVCGIPKPEADNEGCPLNSGPAEVVAGEAVGGAAAFVGADFAVPTTAACNNAVVIATDFTAAAGLAAESFSSSWTANPAAGSEGTQTLPNSGGRRASLRPCGQWAALAAG